MVFKGGGAKGTAFIGSLQAIEEAGLVPGRLIGTSAGSIQAFMMALGYKSAEVYQIMMSKMPNRSGVIRPFLEALFADPPLPADLTDPEIRNSVLGKDLLNAETSLAEVAHKIEITMMKGLFHSNVISEAYNLTERGGVWTGIMLVQWCGERIAERTGLPPDATMKQLYEKTGMDLTLVAACVDNDMRLVLNHRTAPDLPVAWAVRMSTALPFAFANVRWHSSWGKYGIPGLQFNLDGMRVVDGGLVDAFPVDLLVNKSDIAKKVMGRSSDEPDPFIGFLLNGKRPIPGQPMKINDERQSGALLRGISYAEKLVNTMTDFRDTELVLFHKDSIVNCPVGGYGTLELDMTPERAEALVRENRRVARVFIRECWKWRTDQSQELSEEAQSVLKGPELTHQDSYNSPSA